MSQTRTDRFAEALRALEQGDADQLLDLFGEGARLQRPQQDHLGTDEDPQTFWKQYRDQFDSLETSFERIIEIEDEAVLEWHSTGTLSSGRPIDYAGVSLLTFEGDKVVRFATYYDTAAFIVPSE